MLVHCVCGMRMHASTCDGVSRSHDLRGHEISRPPGGPTPSGWGSGPQNGQKWPFLGPLLGQVRKGLRGRKTGYSGKGVQKWVKKGSKKWSRGGFDPSGWGRTPRGSGPPSRVGTPKMTIFGSFLGPILRPTFWGVRNGRAYYIGVFGQNRQKRGPKMGRKWVKKVTKKWPKSLILPKMAKKRVFFGCLKNDHFFDQNFVATFKIKLNDFWPLFFKGSKNDEKTRFFAKMGHFGTPFWRYWIHTAQNPLPYRPLFDGPEMDQKIPKKWDAFLEGTFALNLPQKCKKMVNFWPLGGEKTSIFRHQNCPNFRGH